MMRRARRIESQAASTLALAGALVLGLAGAASHADDAGAGLKENLDMPFEGLALGEDDEEHFEVVWFYRQPFEGDGFFFCIDHSASVASSGDLDIAKREVANAIAQLSNSVRFAIVFFDQGVLKWPASGQPAEANEPAKAQAIAWLSSMRSRGGSCVREGLFTSLGFANRSTANRNQIIYVGDGGTMCPGHDPATYGRDALAQVTAANFKRHPIHSIYTGTASHCVNAEFARELSALNGGTFTNGREPR
jgi:hypothetical protein